MQNACFFSTVNIYMLLHIYRFYSSGCTPAPPRTLCHFTGFRSLCSAGEGSQSAVALGGSMAWGKPPPRCWKGTAALRGIGKARDREQGRPAHACSLATGCHPGPPQGRGAPRSGQQLLLRRRGGGGGMWSPLQQQQQNPKANIWRYSGIFFKK